MHFLLISDNLINLDSQYSNFINWLLDDLKMHCGIFFLHYHKQGEVEMTDSAKQGTRVFSGKGSTAVELLSVAECPSLPSESLTSDISVANPALSRSRPPTCTTDTHTHVMTHSSYLGHLGGREKDEIEKHGSGDKLGQLYMGTIGLQSSHY